MGYQFLADLIVCIHAGYVLYVLIGQLLILIGLWRGWPWVRNWWFRFTHLIAILIVATESVFNVECPLTVWERNLRNLSGNPVDGAGGSWLGKIVHEYLFITAPDWVFGVCYVAFAVLVGVTYWLAPPIRKARAKPVTSLDSRT